MEIMKIIGIVIFLAGIICLGGVFVYVFGWVGWTEGWDHFYTVLIIIGVPCLIIGTILVNKYIKS